MSTVGRRGGRWEDTLANLKTFGTDDGITVGDPAWDTTNGREIVCLTAAAATSTWAYKFTETKILEWAHSGAGAFYVPWHNNADSASTAGVDVSFQAPFAGRILRASVVQNSGAGVAGVCDITLYTGTTGAQPTTAGESQAVTIGGLDASQSVAFTSAASWALDDRIAILFDPATDPQNGYINMTLALEYTVIAS